MVRCGGCSAGLFKQHTVGVLSAFEAAQAKELIWCVRVLIFQTEGERDGVDVEDVQENATHRQAATEPGVIGRSPVQLFQYAVRGPISGMVHRHEVGPRL